MGHLRNPNPEGPRHAICRPLRRAARFDGYAPLKVDGDQFVDLTVAEVGEMAKRLAEEGGASCEISITNGMPADPDEAAALVGDMEEAGATWWQVGPDPSGTEPVEDFRQRVRRGPPA